MENYIALLLLVAPGFMAQRVKEKLNDNRVEKDKFELTIQAMIYSIFVMLLNYMIITYLYGNMGIVEVQRKLATTDFLVRYTLLTIAASITVGIVWNYIEKIYRWCMNKLRGIEKKNPLYDRTVFDSIFADGKEHIVEVQYNGVSAFGNLKRIGDKGSKEVYIKGCYDYDVYRERNPDQLNKIDGVYYDFDAGYSIIEYENDVVISASEASEDE